MSGTHPHGPDCCEVHQPLDPAAIMAAHASHAAFSGGACKPWIASRGPQSEHCHTYRLAAELATERERVADVWDQAHGAGFRDGVKMASAPVGRAVMVTPNPYRAALAGEGAADQPPPATSWASVEIATGAGDPVRPYGAAGQPQGDGHPIKFPEGATITGPLCCVTCGGYVCLDGYPERTDGEWMHVRDWRAKYGVQP